jgi:hypothetical protein
VDASATVPTVSVGPVEASGGAASPGDKYELTIGGKVYAAADGKPFEISIGGQRVQAMIRAKDLLQFAGGGVSFQYPRELAFKEEKAEGVASYTVEGTDSSIVIIQVYSVDIEPQRVSSLLADGIEKEMRSRGGSVSPGSGSPVKRRFRGAEVEGKRFEFSVAKESIQTQIYAMKKGKLTIAVVMQRSDGDAILADRRFEIIADSLR